MNRADDDLAPAVPSEPRWQTIETAPQDRSWFLAWSADLEYFVYRMEPGLIADEEPDPTHWMPLPAPPTASAALPSDLDTRAPKDRCVDCKHYRVEHFHGPACSLCGCPRFAERAEEPSHYEEVRRDVLWAIRDERDALRQEVEARALRIQALEQERDDLRLVVDLVRKELAGAEAALHALNDYVQHKLDCEIARYPHGAIDRDTPQERLPVCTCGLNQVLATLPAQGQS